MQLSNKQAVMRGVRMIEWARACVIQQRMVQDAALYFIIKTSWCRVQALVLKIASSIVWLKICFLCLHMLFDVLCFCVSSGQCQRIPNVICLRRLSHHLSLARALAPSSPANICRMSRPSHDQQCPCLLHLMPACTNTSSVSQHAQPNACEPAGPITAHQGPTPMLAHVLLMLSNRRLKQLTQLSS